MTLATLKGMNFNMGDVANALKLKAADTMMTGVQKVSEKAADTATAVVGRAKARNTGKKSTKVDAKLAANVVDPMQWWGALTQQFQQIATSAMKDAATATAVDTAKNMAVGVAKGALKSATGMAKAATAGARAGSKRAKKGG